MSHLFQGPSFWGHPAVSFRGCNDTSHLHLHIWGLPAIHSSSVKTLRSNRSSNLVETSKIETRNRLDTLLSLFSLRNGCRIPDASSYIIYVRILNHRFIMLIHVTPPKTNIALENGWLQYDCFLLGRLIFRCYVSFREGISFRFSLTVEYKHLQRTWRSSPTWTSTAMVATTPGSLLNIVADRITASGILQFITLQRFGLLGC